jgi:hypothetical protein
MPNFGRSAFNTSGLVYDRILTSFTSINEETEDGHEWRMERELQPRIDLLGNS